jgi:hypothetical protein
MGTSSEDPGEVGIHPAAPAEIQRVMRPSFRLKKRPRKVSGVILQLKNE